MNNFYRTRMSNTTTQQHSGLRAQAYEQQQGGVQARTHEQQHMNNHATACTRALGNNTTMCARAHVNNTVTARART